MQATLFSSWCRDAKISFCARRGGDRSLCWSGAPGGRARSTPSPTQRGKGHLCTFTHHLNVESPKHAHGEYSSEPVSHITQAPAACSALQFYPATVSNTVSPTISPCSPYFVRPSVLISHEFPMSQRPSAARPWLVAPLGLPFPPRCSNPSL